MKEEKKNTKKKILIIGIILIAIIISSICGYFVYKEMKFKEPIKEEWGQKYYVYLKEQDDIVPKESENTKLNFIEVNNQEHPVMVVKYEVKKEVYSNIYFIEDNKVNAIIYQQPSNIELLYNITNNEYNYYFHIENEENYYYQPIDIQINNTIESGASINVTPEIIIGKDDILTGKNEAGEDASLSKVDETFVKIDIEDEYTDLEDFTDKEIKDVIESSIDDYKELDTIITDEVKENVTKQVEEVNAIKEQIDHLSDDEIYSKLKGIWCDKKNGYGFSISDTSPRGKKDGKYFSWGWMFSETFVYEKISEIKYKGNNIYEFVLQTGSYDIDMTNIDKKSIKIDKYTHTYLAKNWDQALEKMY